MGLSCGETEERETAEMKVPINDYNFIDLDAPTLPAKEIINEETGVVQWAVWCKHCQEWHYHGRGEGHREAHCSKLTSPYAASGYNLTLSRQ